MTEERSTSGESERAPVPAVDGGQGGRTGFPRDLPGGSVAAALRVIDLGALDGRLTHTAVVEARGGRHSEWPAWADRDLVTGYRTLGIVRPWEHQVRAADALHAGRHTVISTGTGSGKSLPAWLTAISALRADDIERATSSSGSIARYRRRPTTLYISPTKALAADQLAGISALLEAAQIRSVRVTTCDGDTPYTQRDWAREHGDIVLTNPDFLHMALLPGHRRWTRFLRGLDLIVIDEMHAYRGVLGAHVGLVLRRLLRVARHLGADPVVYVASATSAEPATTAARLIGVGPAEVAAITESTSPEGSRTIALWQGALMDVSLEEGPRRAATSEAAALLTQLVSSRVRTLTFVRSRASAEYVATKTRENLAELRPELVGAVAAYRGGYLPEERREIEQALRDGELLGLATTNALELGIDISGLDAVLIAGWPGSRASLWQQAGRAGRAGHDGVAVFIASSDPLDTYLVHHPESLLTAVEATVFDPENPYVLAPHLCAAAAELPIAEEDLPLFGSRTPDVLERLVSMDLLRRRPSGWYWNLAKGAEPQHLTNLRGAGGEVQVVEAVTGTILGTVNAGSADAAVHEGATYVHRGEVYVVDELVDDVALVHRGDPGYRTRARSVHSIRVVERERAFEWGPVTWGFGTVEVTEQVVGYDRLLPPGMEIVGHYALDMPERLLRTSGVWWTLAADETDVEISGLPGALHAAEHASIGILPLLATCDRWDIGGVSSADHPDTGAPTVFVYDGVAGGAGFAERGFGVARRWLTATLAVLDECACEDGCPACVQSPKCGTGNSPLSRGGAQALLRAVLAHGEDGLAGGEVPGRRVED